MHFLNPLMLWLVLLIPPLGSALVWIAWERRQQIYAFFGEEKLVAKYSKLLSLEAYQFKAIWVFLALAALLVALARPSFEHGKVTIPRGTVDVVTVVDVSRSMAAQDYKGQVTGYYYGGGTRVDMAKHLILTDVVPSLKANHLGIVTYAGKAFPQAFLTDDMPALTWVLKRALHVSSAPGEGSNLTKAFDLAFLLYDLDSTAGHRKIIVLFSDGGNDNGKAGIAEIAMECRRRGIELIVAGLGKLTPSAIPVSELWSDDQEAMKDKQWYESDGEIVRTALDENLLRSLANAAGGRYIRVNNASDFELGSLISPVEIQHKPGEQEVFFYPLALALVFLVLAVVTPLEYQSDKLLRQVPSKSQLRRH